MKFRLKRKAPIPENERQMALAFLVSLYADIEPPQKKPPQPSDPTKVLSLVRKGAA